MAISKTAKLRLALSVLSIFAISICKLPPRDLYSLV